MPASPLPHPRRSQKPGARLAAVAGLVAVATLAPVAVAAAAPTPSPGARPAPAPADGKPSAPRATFGIRASDRQDPRNPNKLGPGDRRGFLLFNGTAGASFSDYVAIANYGLVALTIRVYSTDAYNDTAGGFALLPGNQKPKDSGTWVAIGTAGGTGTVVVAPRSRVVLPVRVRIPAQASPGDHVAGIVASYVSEERRPGQPNVKLDQRVGVRAYIRVAGPVHAQLAVQGLRAVYHGGLGLAARTTVSWTLRNTGNVKLGATQRVRITGPFGRSGQVVGRVEDINVLLPGNSAQMRVDVRGVRPWLLMHARVDVFPGIPSTDVDPGVRPVHAEVAFLAVPWLLVVALLAVLALAYALRRRQRRAGSVAAAAPAAHHRRKGSRRLAPGTSR